ncbi:uncharacterized protein PAC_15060 [Phialocephala subalpina]|uniref:Uncharacterized protein n=1 Tax=Phialocephala subalpina TaxID=576137 RepID=A0A1L7XJD5_9HELO|nr:uncharacterized protein PAC_15060 [Phialocephala subalpina]
MMYVRLEARKKRDKVHNIALRRAQDSLYRGSLKRGGEGLEQWYGRLGCQIPSVATTGGQPIVILSSVVPMIHHIVVTTTTGLPDGQSLCRFLAASSVPRPQTREAPSENQPRLSNDTILTITFGLISILISFASMLIAYLTLRAMNIGNSPDTVLADQDFDRLLGNGTTFRHEHTYYLPEGTSTNELRRKQS